MSISKPEEALPEITRGRRRCKIKASSSNNPAAIQSLIITSIIAIIISIQLIIQPNGSYATDFDGSMSGPEFPGISKDVAAFCSARPSLPIDMATMIVHVKRNISFNYKLYLFSEDYVFQTGQIVPRDDFRIHAFPVKAKRLRDFWPNDVSTFEEGLNSLKPVGSEAFQYRRFFSRVLVNPTLVSAKRTDSSAGSRDEIVVAAVQNDFNGQRSRSPLKISTPTTSSTTTTSSLDPILTANSNADASQSEPVEIKPLPQRMVKRRVTRSNQPSSQLNINRRGNSSSRTRSTTTIPNPNENIDFDRDDQVSLVTAPQRVSPNPSQLQQPPVNPSIMAAALRLRQQPLLASSTAQSSSSSDNTSGTNGNPSASSSSSEAMLVDSDASASDQSATSTNTNQQQHTEYRDTNTVMPVGSFSSFHVNISYFVRKDFGQLTPQLIKVGINAHTFKVNYVTLIRDLSRGPNNENSSDDYNFLTHKLLSDPNTRITAINQIYHDWITRNFYTVVYIQRLIQPQTEVGDLTSDESQISSSSSPQMTPATISNDRLIFRGSSANLLGAVQLDYGVRASAFITDKNGLHYFLDFLISSNKFYIAAVDWTEKPFKFIDSQRFPIRVTRTLLDNEELLLCPPAICHSVQPVDEIVPYGRLNLDSETQRAVGILSGIPDSTNSNSSTSIDLDKVIKRVQEASQDLKIKLHLRDWNWQLEPLSTPSIPKQTRNLARRNVLLNPSSSEHGSSTTTLAPFSPSFLSFNLPSTTSSATSSNSNMNNKPQAKESRLYSWRYKWGQRNEIKARNDIYGFPLTGDNIDAGFRVYNQIHLISANLFITINYAQANDTIVTKKPISDEFNQLSSTIIDPITGVFYDRYANQVFFFKGDRYIGYDYATRKPLEDFLLNDGGKDGASPILSSLPVVGILGRQHSVDSVYHDLVSDLVYVFEGMRFYSYDAKEFKSGSFRSDPSKKLPPIRCINTHFLTGCRFDKAFPNPCRDSTTPIDPSATPSLLQKQQQTNSNSNSRNGKSFQTNRAGSVSTSPSERDVVDGNASSDQSSQPINKTPAKSNDNNEPPKHWPFVPSAQSDQFIGRQQQQNRNRESNSIDKSKLHNNKVLNGGDNPSENIVENDPLVLQRGPIVASAASESGAETEADRRHERALIYMLASLVLLTILATLAIVAVSVYSGNFHRDTNSHKHQQQGKLSSLVAPTSQLLSPHGGLSPSLASHSPIRLAGPYDSLAQLQATALQAAHLQAAAHQQNNHYASLDTTSLGRYFATEPILMDSTGLPPLHLHPEHHHTNTNRSPSSSYGSMGGGGSETGAAGYNRPSPPAPPSLAAKNLATIMKNSQHIVANYIPSNSNTLVVKGRRYDTTTTSRHSPDDVLTDNSAL